MALRKGIRLPGVYSRGQATRSSAWCSASYRRGYSEVMCHTWREPNPLQSFRRKRRPVRNKQTRIVVYLAVVIDHAALRTWAQARATSLVNTDGLLDRHIGLWVSGEPGAAG
jgi:hypothetical protein